MTIEQSIYCLLRGDNKILRANESSLRTTDLDNSVQTYDIGIKHPYNCTSMSMLNEIKSEKKDKHKDREIPKIESLWRILAAIKCISKYISSIEV